MKDRGKRRKDTFKKIRQRVELLTNLTPSWADEIYLPKHRNMLANNNEVNALVGAGVKTKTNTRKASASYRHKGGYGKANKYTPHDQRQLDAMDLEDDV